MVLKSLKCSAPFYEAPIRHESCQTTLPNEIQSLLELPRLLELPPAQNLDVHFVTKVFIAFFFSTRFIFWLSFGIMVVNIAVAIVSIVVRERGLFV